MGLWGVCLFEPICVLVSQSMSEAKSWCSAIVTAEWYNSAGLFFSASPFQST